MPRHYLNVACKNCGKKRTVTKRFLREPTYTGFCKSCAMTTRRGPSNPNWDGGRYEIASGYILTKLRDEDEYFRPTARLDGYIMEHRLFMAKELGRNIGRWEIVHHKNSIRNDNRLENLELLGNSEHIVAHKSGYDDGFEKGYKDGAMKRVRDLEAELAALKTKLAGGK